MDSEFFSTTISSYVAQINQVYILLGKYFYQVCKLKGFNRIPEEEFNFILNYMDDIKTIYARIQTDSRLDAEARDFIYMLTSK